jgi:alpha-beta hydrolase superfamily lysophospholipase
MARIHRLRIVRRRDYCVATGRSCSAWSIRPRHDNGNAVILLHGLGDNRLGTTTGYAELLLSRGFSVLLPDSRAHGSSGGDLATFGLLETGDIHRWLDWLEKTDHPDCIFGLGESMGAALLLQSLQAETRFCAVAAESSFASFREIGLRPHGPFLPHRPMARTHCAAPNSRVCFCICEMELQAGLQSGLS